MKKYILSPNSNILEILLREGTPHLHDFTNQTSYITVPEKGVKYIKTPKRINKTELIFIQKVSSHLKKLKVSRFDNSEISYFKFNKLEPGQYFNLIEVDLSAAYWWAAHQLEYIDDDLFNEGMQVNKGIRLIALGSAASTKKFYQYKGGEYHKYKNTKQNQFGKNAFFNISQFVDMLMINLSEKVPGIFGYWVDAFFCDIKSAETLKNEIANYGANFKCVELTEMNVTKSDGIIRIYLHEKNGREKLLIFFEPSERRQRNIDSFRELLKYIQ